MADYNVDVKHDEIDPTTSTQDQQTLLGNANSINGVWHPDQVSVPLKSPDSFKCVDDVYKSLGKPGRYSIVIFCLLTLNNFSISPNHAIGVFIGYSPPHECSPFQNSTAEHPLSYASFQNLNPLNFSSGVNISSNDTIEEYNTTHFQCKAVRIREGQKDDVSRCKRGQWTYDVRDGESSSVTEWDLVCDRAFLANLANSFYYSGVMVGGILIGYISDVFGRKVALLMSLYSTIVVGASIVFTHHLIAFFVLRTIFGVAIQAPEHLRNGLYSILGPSSGVLGLAAWALKDWRMIQGAAIAQACIAGLYLWMIPESLRWLISQGKQEKASIQVQRIARFNGIQPDPTYTKGSLVSDLTTGITKERVSCLDLFRTPQLRKRTFLMSYITFATNVGYWGLTYNTTSMVGDRYLNYTLGSVAETILSVANVFVISRFGKRIALISYFLCGGICCIVMSFLLTETGDPYVSIFWIFSFIGRLTSGGLFVANDLYMAELFPTSVRNMGMGVCTFMGRIGAIITPLIFTAGLYTFERLPLIVFGLITIVGSLITLTLPETGKLKLPETLEDVTIMVAIPMDNTTKNDKLISSQQPNDDKVSEGSGHT